MRANIATAVSFALFLVSQATGQQLSDGPGEGVIPGDGGIGPIQPTTTVIQDLTTSTIAGDPTSVPIVPVTSSISTTLIPPSTSRATTTLSTTVMRPTSSTRPLANLTSTVAITTMSTTLSVAPVRTAQPTNHSTASNSDNSSNSKSSNFLLASAIAGGVIAAAVLGIYIFRKTTLRKSDHFKERLNPDYVPSFKGSNRGSADTLSYPEYEKPAVPKLEEVTMNEYYPPQMYAINENEAIASPYQQPYYVQNHPGMAPAPYQTSYVSSGLSSRSDSVDNSKI